MTDAEARRLKQIESFRKIELIDKIERKKRDIKEALCEEDFSKYLEEYMMNRTRNYPEFIEDASIAEAAMEFLEKEAEKKRKRDKPELNL